MLTRNEFCAVVAITILALLVVNFGWKTVARLAHRYLGIAVGWVALIVCATGATMTIGPELERWSEPSRYRALKIDSASRLPLDEFVSKYNEVESRERVPVEIARLIVPISPKRTYRLYVRREGERRAEIVDANPYNGRPTGRGPSRVEPFLREMRIWHRFLGTPWKIGEKEIVSRKTGRAIVGWSTLVVAIVLLTGLIRWFPHPIKSWARWKTGLTLTVTKGGARALYDSHNVLGFYVCLPFFLLATTGVWLAFPWASRPVAGLLNEQSSTSSLYVSADASRAASLEKIVREQLEIVGKRELEIAFPQSGTLEPYEIYVGDGRFFGPLRPDVYYWDASTGEPLGKELIKDLSWKRKIALALLPLHRGEICGPAFRWFFFLVCVVSASLATTGYWLTFKRWNRSLFSKKKMGARTRDALQTKQSLRNAPR